ncbi:hypothetical protein KORDIASMS9_04059 [Kordia sp. SMS9]|uniref:hypothetical protein n=1 Tax=Kordia sp. SMS9 TaxID=2282170 RepID=UPI000E0D779C|nr:hypothetical protein [Kordia sp. SMS9]AXG71801.1 hypothetical protein KORDIASMS9_04059 [Kordia sp. SMS9]
MKIVKQITVALVLLVSFNTHATTACIEDTEDIKNRLITEMAEDDAVASLYVNLAFVSFIESAKKEFDISGEEFEINYEKLQTGLNTDLEIIRNKYPEFYDLSEEDKKDVTKGLRSRSKKIKDTVNCVIAGTVGIGTACGLTFAQRALKKYGACMLAGGLFEIAEVILSEGSASGLIPEQMSGINTMCLRFALRLDRVTAETIGSCIVIGLLAEISACGTIYFLS